MNQLSRFKRSSSFTKYLALGSAALLALVSGALAQEGSKRGGIEEVVVTAQRSEQGLQDVPIAVTALSGAMLEERQVINPSDLQLNTPNVTFTATNFGNFSTSIRGIGRLVISTSGEAGVSNHVNEIPITSNQNAIEFFDVERVEILRGPQGTLFGRNATGGSVNVVTKMPEFDSTHGFVDAEIGDFNNVRFKGAFNLPLAENLAVRFAGLDLKRDGYIRNLAYGQVSVDADDNPTGNTLPGIKDTIDGRNLSAFRITALWDVTDNASLWLQYNNFRENDDRARITNQVCKQTALATTGCEPNVAGFETPHLATNTGALFAMFGGALPPRPGNGNSPAVIPAGQGPLTYDFPRPVAELGLRSIHTDFQPIFKQDEENVLFGMDIELGSLSLGILAAYQETEYFSRQDFNMDVGPMLNASPNNPSGNFPTAQIPTNIHGDLSGPCAVVDPNNPGLGLAGAGPHHQTAPGQGGPLAGTPPITNSPCIHPSDQTRVFSYDQVGNVFNYWTAEAALASNFNGRLNFNVGVTGYGSETMSDYYVVSNTLDAAVYQGIGGNRVYPGYFNSRTNLLEQEGIAAYGEIYFDLTDTLKITGGVRVNEDTKNLLDSGVLANAAFFNPEVLRPLVGTLLPPGIVEAYGDGRYYRTTLAPLLAPNMAGAAAALVGLARTASTLTGVSDDNVNARLLAIYNTPEQLAAAFAVLGAPAPTTREGGAARAIANAAALAPVLGRVPIVPRPGETRIAQLSPNESTEQEVTGRIGVDWNITNDILVYGFFTRGFKPGGFNPNVPEELRSANSPFQLNFDSESITSVEFGAKTTFFDGKMTLNGNAFMYDYEGLQITRIVNNTSLNENIDAEVSGIELELVWAPFERLTIDAAYSFLDSTIKRGTGSVDPVNRTAGNEDWLIFTNIDGAATGTNYIALREAFTPTVIAAIGAQVAAARAPGSMTTNLAPFLGLSAAGFTGLEHEGGIPIHLHRDELRDILKADTANMLTTEEQIDTVVSNGLPTDLSGNQLPNSPEHTIHVGLTLRQNIEAIRGELSLRWDYYWQDVSFARDFNTVGDRIGAWDQHNLSLNYNSSDGVIQGRIWMRNVLNDENVTGKYLTSDTTGFFRNHFLTEPRIFGASIRYNFGL